MPVKFTEKAFSIIDSSEFNIILGKNKSGCLFCTPNSEKKILFETENFFITFDDSPLIDGHLLIHSKEHLACSAEISSDLYEEYEEVKNIVSEVLLEIYGSLAFYEHGRAGHCAMNFEQVMCEHFHLHALPIKTNISSILNKSFKEVIVESQQEIFDLYEQYDQYLYFEIEKKRYFYIVTDKIPSHFLRTVIANQLNTAQKADWSNCTDLESINRFKKELIKNYE